MESAWKAAADQARKQILETAEWRKKAKAAQAVADALHASEARIYPDVAFEQYLDDTIGSLVDVVEDRANNGDEHGAAAIRQAVEAIGHLRRTRDELRRDMEHLGLAALSTRPQEQP